MIARAGSRSAARQVVRVQGLSQRVSGEHVAELEQPAVGVQVRLVVRASSIDAVEVESRRPEVDQRVGIVLALEARGRVECQVVVDELAEIGVRRRDPALLVVGTVLRRGLRRTPSPRPGCAAHRFDWTSSSPKSAGGRARNMRPNRPLKNLELGARLNPRTPAPCGVGLATVVNLLPRARWCALLVRRSQPRLSMRRACPQPGTAPRVSLTTLIQQASRGQGREVNSLSH